MFVAAPGVCEVAMIYATPGGNAVNIHHVKHDDGSAWSDTQIVALLNIFDNWEQTVGRLRRVSAVACLRKTGRDLTTAHGAEDALGGNSSGTLAGNPLPDNATIAIKKSTGLAGRAFRGRIYWIGLSVSKQTNDTYDGTEIGNIVSAMENLRTSIEAAGPVHMVLVHKQIDGVVQNPRTTTNIVSHTSVDNVIDSQRRRLLGHNIHR